jgi:hypothetical protein
MRRRFAFAVVLLATFVARAGEQTLIEDLAWMSGRWAGTIDGVQMEEQWTEPRAGLLIGLHRDVKKDGRASFEFMRIAETDRGLVLFAQPGGRAATEFALAESGLTRAVFANPSHDFPKRIVYWREGARLCARVEGDGEEGEEWCWDRVAD